MLIKDLSEIVANTPLLHLRKISTPNQNKILGKCEFLNPAGGVKDRIGLYMVKQAKKRGVLKKGSVIIEPTAGNTGLGIALGALKYNYPCIMVVPSKFSSQKQILMKALGAKIINTPAQEGMQGAINKTKELLAEIKHSISLSQFDNPDNPKAHYSTTAKELYKDCKGAIDYFVCGAGSGGTFSGIAQYLKEKNPKIKAILCDPLDSIIGGNSQNICSKIEGIGNDFIPKNIDINLIDEVIKISDEEALEGVRILASKQGILAGISSGAHLMASLKLAQRVKNKTIITIFADKLERYLDRELLKNL
ncbi:PLP-dependent cysteine synthase family protein [Campylobacter cuniculorum]|uniref:PLP-dependent cysteine synthase family protein n=1 Tax=Campylobacter cuniculorum TaxID=374106 RepID=UPI0023F07A15|nr:cysteine synthase family protein [Campylobacter cuniculorum]